MIVIRKAELGDVEKLQELNEDAFVNNSQFDPDLIVDWSHSEKAKNYFTTTIQNPEHLLLVAQEGETLVGYISASPKTFGHRKSRYIEIENLGIAPAYRRQGVASTLMAECLSWAKQQGYQKAYLGCYSKNTTSLAFYKQHGFSEIDVSLEKVL